MEANGKIMITEKVALTDLQLAYLFGRNALIDNKEISTCAFYEFENSLDVVRFEKALNSEIQRQEMLRTVFTNDGKQIFRKECPVYQIPINDFSALAPIEADEKLLEVRRDFIGEKVAVDSWPLFAVKAVLLPSGKKHFLFRCDMLITDAAGMRIFLNETLQIYLGNDVWLPEIQSSYQKFVRHTIKKKESLKYQKDKAFWNQELEDFPKAPKLPVIDRKAEGDFSRFTYRIDPEEWKGMQETARRHGVLPAIVFSTIYAEVLSRWSSNLDFTLNVTTTDRKKEYEDVIGNFSSIFLLPIHHETLAGNDFWERAVRMQQCYMHYFRHGSYSGLELERRLMTGGSGMQDQAAFPVVYTCMLKNEKVKQHVPDILGRTVFSMSQTPQVYLDFQVHEMNNGVTLTWDYLKDAYPPGLVHEMFAQFSAQVTGLIQNKGNVGKGVWRLSDRLESIRTAYNQTKKEFPLTTLQELTAEALAKGKERICLKDGEHVYTYEEVLQRSQNIAECLNGYEIGVGNCVVVEGNRNADTVIAILGIILSGAAYVPLNPDDPEQRKKEICEICEANAYLSGSRLEILQEGGGQIKKRAVKEDLAYCIFTSGTTGKPKGVMITQEGAANTVQDIVIRFGMTEKDRFLLVSSFSFDLSVFDIFGAIYAGGLIYVSKGAKNIYALRQICRKEEITIWNSVPAIWKLVLDGIGSGEQLPKMRVIMLSGDKIPQDLFTASRLICPQAAFISLGGATEASVWSILYKVDEIKDSFRGRIPYGYPMSNQKIYVLDEEQNFCFPEVEGEICIGGLGVALGYKGDEEQTRAHFMDHPQYGRIYRTGDWGVFRWEGYVDIYGRIDKQIKLNGFRIELDEIEICLKSLRGIREAVAMVQTRDEDHKQIAAFLVLEDPKTPVAEKDISEYLRQKLPEYMVPKTYAVIEKLPLTANGKLDREKLTAYESKPSAVKECVPPANALEEKLWHLWGTVLEIRDYGVTESIFTMETDSLLLLSLLDKINLKFHTDVSIEEFLGHTSIRRMADFLKDEKGAMSFQTRPNGII